MSKLTMILTILLVVGLIAFDQSTTYQMDREDASWGIAEGISITLSQLQ